MVQNPAFWAFPGRLLCVLMTWFLYVILFFFLKYFNQNVSCRQCVFLCSILQFKKMKFKPQNQYETMKKLKRLDRKGMLGQLKKVILILNSRTNLRFLFILVKKHVCSCVLVVIKFPIFNLFVSFRLFGWGALVIL